MLLIGLTGGMGCGISTAASYFAELGAIILSADQIARELTRPKAAGWNLIRKAFGKDFFFTDEQLNRPLLGQLVFSDKLALTKLNELLHPLIVSEIRLRIEPWRTTDKIVIIEAPLLIEVGLDTFVDLLAVVNTSLPKRLERLIIRTGLDETDILNRIASQQPLEEKLLLADVIIENNKNLNKLKEEVTTKWLNWQKAMPQ